MHKECMFVTHRVRVKVKLMDVRVRARAKSTCLVCKRTRDHHHITSH